MNNVAIDIDHLSFRYGQLAFLRQGKVIAQGPPEELKAGYGGGGPEARLLMEHQYRVVP